MLTFFFNGVEEVVERYYIVIPFYDVFHDLTYGDMVSQMILDCLEKGVLPWKNLSGNWGLRI